MTTLKPRNSTSLRSIRWRLRPGARAASWRTNRGYASCVLRPGCSSTWCNPGGLPTTRHRVISHTVPLLCSLNPFIAGHCFLYWKSARKRVDDLLVSNPFIASAASVACYLR